MSEHALPDGRLCHGIALLVELVVFLGHHQLASGYCSNSQTEYSRCDWMMALQGVLLCMGRTGSASSRS